MTTRSPRNDCEARAESGAKAAVGNTMTIVDGGHSGAGLVMSRRRRKGEKLSDWKQAHYRLKYGTSLRRWCESVGFREPAVQVPAALLASSMLDGETSCGGERSTRDKQAHQRKASKEPHD